MAIRCFIDPLDPADDVCDTCYGSYCSDHLVHTKGRKNPICVECALKVSGVRGGGRIQPVGDPKTAKSRRRELQQDSNRQSAAFAYFDDPDYGADQAPVEEKSEEPERRVNAATPRPDPQPGPEIAYPSLPTTETEPVEGAATEDSDVLDQPEPAEAVPASAFAEKPLAPAELAAAPAPTHAGERTDSPNPKFAEVAQTRLSTRSEPTPLERLLAHPTSQTLVDQESADQTEPLTTDAPDPLASFRREEPDRKVDASPADVPEPVTKASNPRPTPTVPIPKTPETTAPAATAAEVRQPETSPTPSSAEPSERKVKTTEPMPAAEPEADTLPPVITSGGTILDQIIQDKQSRAQQIASKMAERLAPDET